MLNVAVSMQYRDKIVQRLKNHGISPTEQRVQIAQLLFARPQHLSAEQVLSVLNENGPVVSKATIYNTLGLFAAKGLIREVIVDPSKVFYDSNTSNHHHFFNLDTGELQDIHAEQIQINLQSQLPQGTESVGVDVIVRVKNS